MSLRRITDDKIAAKQNVQARTIQNRIKDPGSMQLRDLWDLAEILMLRWGGTGRRRSAGGNDGKVDANEIRLKILCRALYVVFLTAPPPLISAF